MKQEINSKPIFDIVIQLAFLALIVAWCLMLVLPFTSIMLWGMILAMALFPLHKIISNKIGGKPKIASFIIVIIGLIIIIVPTWLFLDSIIMGLKEIKTSFTEGTLTIPPPTDKVASWPLVGEELYDFWMALSTNLQDTITKYSDQLTSFAKSIVSGTVSMTVGILQFIVSLIIAGVLIVAPGTENAAEKFFGRLVGNKSKEYIELTTKTVSNVVKGILGVAIIQSFFIGLGLLLAGVPHAGLWTLIVFMFGVLQLPPTLVTIPIMIYLFSILSPVAAVLWTVYLIVASLSDNFLKPILLGKGAPVPMLVIFLGVVGGFILSGFIGLFTGAIVLSLGYKLFLLWLNDPETTT